MKWLLWVGLGGLSCAACGGSGVGKPIAQFPSQADLNDLASGTRGTPKGSTGIADVDSWQMQAPEGQQARYPNESNWDKLALSTAQAHDNSETLSAQLRCAAQEAARFYTVNSGMPDDGLREHLLLRCGSSLSAHSFAYVTQQVPDNVSSAEIENSMRNDVQKMLDAGFHEAHGQLGLGWARGGGRYAVVEISGVPRAVLRDFSPIPGRNYRRATDEIRSDVSDRKHTGHRSRRHALPRARRSLGSICRTVHRHEPRRSNGRGEKSFEICAGALIRAKSRRHGVS
jgi:hypothetical protein